MKAILKQKRFLVFAALGLISIILLMVFTLPLRRAIGWFLLSLLVLILLVLFVPGTLKISIQKNEVMAKIRMLVFPLVVSFSEGELTAKVCLFGFWIKLLPAKPFKNKKHKKEVAPPPQEEKETEEEKQKKRTLSEMVELIELISSAISKAMKIILRGMWVRKVELVVPVYDENAALLAKKYGRMQAVIGTARATLNNVFNIKFKRLEVIPDYLNQYSDNFYFSCKITSTLFIMLLAGLLGIIRFFKSKQRATNRQKAVRKIIEKRMQKEQI